MPPQRKKTYDARPKGQEKSEVTVIPTEEAQKYVMGRVFPIIDPTDKCEVRFVLIVGNPGSAKSTGARDIISTILSDPKRPDITPKNSNWKCVNSIHMFFEMLDDKTYQFMIFEDAYDSLGSRESQKGSRIGGLKKIFRIRHVVDERKKKRFIERNKELFDEYKEDIAKLEWRLKRGGLIVIIFTCQTIGIDKGVLDMISLFLLKTNGNNKSTRALTKDYLFGNKEAIIALDDISDLLAHPIPAIRNIGKSLVVFKIYNAIGLLPMFEMHKNTDLYEWNELPEQEVSPKAVKEAKRRRILGFVDDITRDLKGVDDIKDYMIDGWALLTGAEISKSDLTDVKRVLKTIIAFEAEGIDITDTELAESSDEQKGGMSGDTKSDPFSLPVEVSALVAGRSARKEHINQWLGSCCVPIGETDPSVWTSGEDIERSYTEWCEDKQIRTKTRQSLMLALKKRGYEVSVKDTSGKSAKRGVCQLKLLTCDT